MIRFLQFAVRKAGHMETKTIVWFDFLHVFYRWLKRTADKSCRQKKHSLWKYSLNRQIIERWITVDSRFPNRNEPANEIMALFVLCKLILQTHLHSHPVGLDVWFLVRPFVYFHTSCVRTAKALARLRACAGSPEASPVAYVISTIISRAGSNILLLYITVTFVLYSSLIYRCNKVIIYLLLLAPFANL